MEREDGFSSEEEESASLPATAGGAQLGGGANLPSRLVCAAPACAADGGAAQRAQKRRWPQEESGHASPARAKLGGHFEDRRLGTDLDSLLHAAGPDGVRYARGHFFPLRESRASQPSGLSGPSMPACYPLADQSCPESSPKTQ
ncbi:UNVERIFIED_CONTAM: hypothetical protein K2H54_053525 [Gekko kuhli]